MFIAVNRFRLAKGSEAAFEQVWMSRDSHLDKVPGSVEFHLLKGGSHASPTGGPEVTLTRRSQTDRTLAISKN